MDILKALKNRSVLRSRTNSHRYFYFVNGRLCTFETHEKDFNSAIAAIFGSLNSFFMDPSQSVVKFATTAALIGVLGFSQLNQTAQALPQGERSVAGDVQFQRSADNKTFNVRTGARRSIVDYNSFNIGHDETVNFQLPGRTSAILNRVTGGSASEIFGRLNGNGQIFLVNPSGILFGSTAQVNVGSLFASTLNISNENFLNGVLRFERVAGSAPASVINEGSINVEPGGYAVLSGSQVINRGSINTPGGTTVLAVGDVVNMNVDDGLSIQVSVDEELQDSVDQLQDAISNTGTIQADGGSISLQAKLANNLYQRAVNNQGRLQAQGVDFNDPTSISLMGTGARVENSGIIDATGIQGGTVEMHGDYVAHTDGVIDASGTQGGGTVHLGGAWQGSGDQPNAQLTFMGENAQIKANAIETGDGGEVVLWADNATGFFGSIEAKGGSQSGNGGNVEVSGVNFLAFEGQVDTTAANGNTGNLLLDPTDIYVVNDATTTNATLSTVDQFGDPNLHSGFTRTNIRASAISAANSNVTLQANQDIYFESAINNTQNNFNLTATAGDDITVNASITSTSATNGNITLTAGDDIDVNANISSNHGNILLDAGNGNNNNITLDANLSSTSGDVTLLAGDDITLNGDITTTSATAGQGDVLVNSGGSVSQTGSNPISTNAGNVTFVAADNITTNSTITSTSGNINIDAGDDIDINANITNTSGFIRLDGGGSSSDDVTIDANLSTASGDIDVVTGGSVEIDGDLTTTSSTAGQGDITISADRNITLTSGDPISTNAGNVTLDANEDISTSSTITTVSGNVTLEAGSGSNDNVDVNASINSTSGSVGLIAGQDVNVNNTITTSTGGISIDAGEDADISANISADRVLVESDGNVRVTEDITANGSFSSSGIVLKADTNQNGNGNLEIYNGAILNSTNQNITLSGAELVFDLGSGASINAGGGTVFLLGSTNSQGYNVYYENSILPPGGTGDSTTSAVDVNQIELDRITANIIQIGSTSSTGSFDIEAMDLSSGAYAYNRLVFAGKNLTPDFHYSTLSTGFTENGLRVLTGRTVEFLGQNSVTFNESFRLFGNNSSLLLTTSSTVGGTGDITLNNSNLRGDYQIVLNAIRDVKQTGTGIITAPNLSVAAGRNVFSLSPFNTSVDNVSFNVVGNVSEFYNNKAINITSADVGGNLDLEADGDVTVGGAFTVGSTDLDSNTGDINVNNAINSTGYVNLVANTAIDVNAQVNGSNLYLDGPTINLAANLNNSGTLDGTGTTVNVLNNTAQIQDGVDVAADGGTATVNLAATTFTEQVIIDKNIVLDGAGQGLTIINAPAAMVSRFTPAASSPIAPVLYVNGTGSGSTISDLTIEGNGNAPVGSHFAGIGFYNAGGNVTNVTLNNFVSTTDNGYGIYAITNNNVAQTLTLTDTTISNSEWGVLFRSSNTLNSNTLGFVGTNTFTNNTTGLVIDGSLTAISGNTLGNAVFSGGTNFISLDSNALDNLDIDAESVTFDGKTGATWLSEGNLAKLFEIEGKIFHELDDNSVGLIDFLAGGVVVTNGNSIQAGVDAASAGETVYVDFGTYNNEPSNTVNIWQDVDLSFGRNGASTGTVDIQAQLTSSNNENIDLEATEDTNVDVSGAVDSDNDLNVVLGADSSFDFNETIAADHDINVDFDGDTGTVNVFNTSSAPIAVDAGNSIDIEIGDDAAPVNFNTLNIVGKVNAPTDINIDVDGNSNTITTGEIDPVNFVSTTVGNNNVIGFGNISSTTNLTIDVTGTGNSLTTGSLDSTNVEVDINDGAGADNNSTVSLGAITATGNLSLTTEVSDITVNGNIAQSGGAGSSAILKAGENLDGARRFFLNGDLTIADGADVAIRGRGDQANNLLNDSFFTSMNSVFNTFDLYARNNNVEFGGTKLQATNGITINSRDGFYQDDAGSFRFYTDTFNITVNNGSVGRVTSSTARPIYYGSLTNGGTTTVNLDVWGSDPSANAYLYQTRGNATINGANPNGRIFRGDQIILTSVGNLIVNGGANALTHIDGNSAWFFTTGTNKQITLNANTNLANSFWSHGYAGTDFTLASGRQLHAGTDIWLGYLPSPSAFTLDNVSLFGSVSLGNSAELVIRNTGDTVLNSVVSNLNSGRVDVVSGRSIIANVGLAHDVISLVTTNASGLGSISTQSLSGTSSVDLHTNTGPVIVSGPITSSAGYVDIDTQGDFSALILTGKIDAATAINLDTQGDFSGIINAGGLDPLTIHAETFGDFSGIIIGGDVVASQQTQLLTHGNTSGIIVSGSVMGTNTLTQLETFGLNSGITLSDGSGSGYGNGSVTTTDGNLVIRTHRDNTSNINIAGNITSLGGAGDFTRLQGSDPGTFSGNQADINVGGLITIGDGQDLTIHQNRGNIFNNAFFTANVNRTFDDVVLSSRSPITIGYWDGGVVNNTWNVNNLFVNTNSINTTGGNNGVINLNGNINANNDIYVYAYHSSSDVNINGNLTANQDIVLWGGHENVQFSQRTGTLITANRLSLQGTDGQHNVGDPLGPDFGSSANPLLTSVNTLAVYAPNDSSSAFVSNNKSMELEASNVGGTLEVTVTGAGNDLTVSGNRNNTFLRYDWASGNPLYFTNDAGQHTFVAWTNPNTNGRLYANTFNLTAQHDIIQNSVNMGIPTGSTLNFNAVTGSIYRNSPFITDVNHMTVLAGVDADIENLSRPVMTLGPSTVGNTFKLVTNGGLDVIGNVQAGNIDFDALVYNDGLNDYSDINFNAYTRALWNFSAYAHGAGNINTHGAGIYVETGTNGIPTITEFVTDTGEIGNTSTDNGFGNRLFIEAQGLTNRVSFRTTDGNVSVLERTSLGYLDTSNALNGTFDLFAKGYINVFGDVTADNINLSSNMLAGVDFGGYFIGDTFIDSAASLNAQNGNVFVDAERKILNYGDVDASNRVIFDAVRDIYHAGTVDAQGASGGAPGAETVFFTSQLGNIDLVGGAPDSSGRVFTSVGDVGFYANNGIITLTGGGGLESGSIISGDTVRVDGIGLLMLGGAGDYSGSISALNDVDLNLTGFTAFGGTVLYTPSLYAGPFAGPNGLVFPIMGWATDPGFSDDSTTAVPLGFTFNFYGTDYTDAYFSSNGFIWLGSNGGSDCCSPEPLPSLDGNYMGRGNIALYHEDLHPPAGDQWFEPMADAYVFSYINTPFFSSSGNFNGQIALMRAGNSLGLPANSILLSYGTGLNPSGNSGSVGLNAGDGVNFATLNPLGIGPVNGVLAPGDLTGTLQGNAYVFTPAAGGGFVGGFQNRAGAGFNSGAVISRSGNNTIDIDSPSQDIGGQIDAGANGNVNLDATMHPSGYIVDQPDNVTYIHANNLDARATTFIGDGPGNRLDTDVNYMTIFAGDNAHLDEDDDVNVGPSQVVTGDFDLTAGGHVTFVGDTNAGTDVLVVAGTGITVNPLVTVQAFNDDVEFTALTGDITNNGNVLTFPGGDDVDFDAQTGNVVNNGNVIAGDAFTFLAFNDILNNGVADAQGSDGILSAANGDVINGFGAIIEAANDVSMNAGSDVRNFGTVRGFNNVFGNAFAGELQNDGNIFGTNFVNLNSNLNMFGTGLVTGDTSNLRSFNGNIGSRDEFFSLDVNNLSAQAPTGDVHLDNLGGVNLINLSNALGRFRLAALGAGNMNILGSVTSNQLSLTTEDGSIAFNGPATGSEVAFIRALGGNITGIQPISGRILHLIAPNGGINVVTDTRFIEDLIAGQNATVTNTNGRLLTVNTSTVNGILSINTPGSLAINGLLTGLNGVNLTAGGNILDSNTGLDVLARGNSRFIAGGFIGAPGGGDAIDVDIQGRLFVSAGRALDGVAVAIDGTVTGGIETIGSLPGDLLFNGVNPNAPNATAINNTIASLVYDYNNLLRRNTEADQLTTSASLLNSSAPIVDQLVPVEPFDLRMVPDGDGFLLMLIEEPLSAPGMKKNIFTPGPQTAPEATPTTPVAPTDKKGPDKDEQFQF